MSAPERRAQVGASMSEPGEVLRYRAPKDPQRLTAYIGMVIFMGAWAMMFACFFFAYGALRLGTKEWPPIGQPAAPVGMLALNTAIALLSSAALEGGLWAMRRRLERWLAPSLAAGAVLGSLFLVLQSVVGRELYQRGLTPWSGPYASVFYGLVGVHAMHMAVGVLALCWLLVRALRGAYSTPRHLPVRLWAMYWHFVGVIWVLMFLLVFSG